MDRAQPKRQKLSAKLTAHWHEKQTAACGLVEDQVPALLAAASRTLLEDISPRWREAISEVRANVLKDAEADAADEAEWFRHEGIAAEAASSPEHFRVTRWAMALVRIRGVLSLLFDYVGQDIGLAEGESLTAMTLVLLAVNQLEWTLTNIGGADPELDPGEVGVQEEQQYRLRKALDALDRRRDDIHLRRFRAMHVAESCAVYTPDVVSPAEVESMLRQMRDDGEFSDEEDEARERDVLSTDRYVLAAAQARAWLAEVDERFATLSPEAVLQEFAEVEPFPRGGRGNDGEGRAGPLRALARLALLSGALEYRQRDGETFDDAVERVRGNLLVTRSRLRRELPRCANGDCVGESLAPERGAGGAAS